MRGAPGVGSDRRGVGRGLEVAAGLAGLAWALVSGLRLLHPATAEPFPGPALALSRYLLLALVGVPWLLAATGFVAGLRGCRFAAMVPLLLGTAGLVVGALAPARPLPVLSVISLGLAVLLRARRVPAHPMAYLGVFATGFVLTVLGHVTWVTLLLTAPRR